LDALLDEERTAALKREGLLARQGDRLQVTSSGMLLLEAILAEIVRLD
jgi:oxygen-independent coproporphyrinogen-3 oxidase